MSTRSGRRYAQPSQPVEEKEPSPLPPLLSSLPDELRFKITGLLDTESLLAARLASRLMKQLFSPLIKEGMLFLPNLSSFVSTSTHVLSTQYRAASKYAAAFGGLTTLTLHASDTVVDLSGTRSKAKVQQLERFKGVLNKGILQRLHLGLPHLAHLRLVGDGVHAMLRHPGALAVLDNLQSLDIARQPVWGCHLPAVAELESLASLHMDCRGATVAQMSSLTKLSQLEELRVQIGGLRDAHIQAIASFTSLRRLHMLGSNYDLYSESEQPYSVAAIEALGALSRLEVLKTHILVGGYRSAPHLSLAAWQPTLQRLAPTLRQLELRTAFSKARVTFSLSTRQRRAANAPLVPLVRHDRYYFSPYNMPDIAQCAEHGMVELHTSTNPNDQRAQWLVDNAARVEAELGVHVCMGCTCRL